MAAVFPLDTSTPWVVNGVTYEYDSVEQRWYVVSTSATDQVVDTINTIRNELEETNETITDELEIRDQLINAATGKNDAQDAAIAELDARVDSISANIGILEFKGIYTYTIERSESACNSAYVACQQAANNDPNLIGECNRLYNQCISEVGDPLADGTFTSVGSNVLSDVDELIITNTDKNGDSLDWINVLNNGDYLELTEPNTIDGGVTGGDTVLYEVITDPLRSGNQENIRVKFIKETGNGDGLFDPQIDYIIRVFKKDLGIDINEADNRYVNRIGDTMNGSLVIDNNTITGWALKVAGEDPDNPNLTVWNNGGISTKYTDFKDNEYVTKKYVEDEFNTLDERYLKKTGGNLDGSLSIDGTLSFKRGEKDSNQFKVSPNGGSDFNTNIYGLNGGSIRFRTSHTNNEGDYVGSHIILDPNNGDPQTKIYNLIEPTKNSMPATREYADKKISKEGDNFLPDATNWKIKQKNSSGTDKTLINVKSGELGLYNLKAPTESHHAATRKYVDDMGGGPKPAQLSWIYDGSKDSTTSAPADGKFYKNNDFLRFSFKTSNGVDLSNGLVSDTGAISTDYGPVGVIWYYDNGRKNWKMKRQFRTNGWRWNYNGHFEFELSSSKGHGWSTLTEGVQYYITIGGWF